MIARGRYIKGGSANQASAASHLNSHLKYLEHRSRDEQESREDRSIFSKDDDQVNRRDAVDEVMEHTSGSVSYHKIVRSPGEDEPVQDWREWTREVMADLEEEQGIDLHWYAVHHSKTEHEHVHVVLAGAGENWGTGHEEAVKLYPAALRKARDLPKAHDVDALGIATYEIGEMVPYDREHFYQVTFRPRRTRRRYHDLPRKGQGRVRYQVNEQLGGFRKGDIVCVKGKYIKQINAIYSEGRLDFKRVKGEPPSALPKDCQILERGRMMLWEKLS